MIHKCCENDSLVQERRQNKMKFNGFNITIFLKNGQKIAYRLLHRQKRKINNKVYNAGEKVTNAPLKTSKRIKPTTHSVGLAYK